jgi:protein SCO1/2|tara:strand:+ start:582 stop:1241 length:660 start_codon:yes stop_codon:yes gene_type:complete
MNKYIFIIIAVLSVSAGIVGFRLIMQTKQLPPPEFALHYQQARTMAAFSLTDEQGHIFNNAQLNDKWSLIFFGYTSCPDVCPITLQNLNFIYDELKGIANNTQVLLVSVDPQRDSVEKLAQYIDFFNPEFKALRAEHDILFPFARSLGLMYSITQDTQGEQFQSTDQYWVDHSASIVLINPKGKVAAIFRPEQVIGEAPTINNDKLLSDYQKIVALYFS